jgi:hypothetical protein
VPDRLAAAKALLQARHVRVDHGGIALDREQQRHVDADALGGRLAERIHPGGGGGDLDHRVGPVDTRPQSVHCTDGSMDVVGELGRHLEADEAVRAPAARVHR